MLLHKPSACSVLCVAMPAGDRLGKTQSVAAALAECIVRPDAASVTLKLMSTVSWLHIQMICWKCAYMYEQPCARLCTPPDKAVTCKLHNCKWNNRQHDLWNMTISEGSQA